MSRRISARLAAWADGFMAVIGTMAVPFVQYVGAAAGVVVGLSLGFECVHAVKRMQAATLARALVVVVTVVWFVALVAYFRKDGEE